MNHSTKPYKLPSQTRELVFDEAPSPFCNTLLTDLTWIIAPKEEGFPEYRMTSLKELLQRSNSFNGDECQLFHKYLKSQEPKEKLSFKKNQKLKVQLQSSNGIWCQENEIIVQENG